MTNWIRTVITLYWSLLAIAIGTGSMAAVAWSLIHTEGLPPRFHHLLIGAFALAGFLAAAAAVTWVLWTAPSTPSTSAQQEARY